MHSSKKKKGIGLFTLRMPVLVLAFFVLLGALPFSRAQASAVSAVVDRKTTLEQAVLAAAGNGEKETLAAIDRLTVQGEGTLTADDGAFIREHLPNLLQLDLSGFKGDFEDGAFRGCNTLQLVRLPERARLSREMFYGCSSLEEVDWPVRLQLTNDCFAYCALDFSGGFPSLLNEGNVITYAANQRPKVYFGLAGSGYSTITAGSAFRAPYSLLTREGGSYTALVQSAPSWLLTRPEELQVTQRIQKDGEFTEELDTTQSGEYEIVYSLPYTTYADVRSLTYTLTILPSTSELAPLIRAARQKTAAGYTDESWQALKTALEDAEAVMESGSAQTAVDAARDALRRAMEGLEVSLSGAPEVIRVGDTFRLTPGRGEARDAEGWEWDRAYFNTSFTTGAEFTALRQGKTEIVYIDNSGDKGTLEVDIQPAQSSVDIRPQGSSGGTAPTGDTAATGALWVLAGGSLTALLAALFLRRKKV